MLMFVDGHANWRKLELALVIVVHLGINLIQHDLMLSLRHVISMSVVSFYGNHVLNRHKIPWPSTILWLYDWVSFCVDA